MARTVNIRIGTPPDAGYPNSARSGYQLSPGYAGSLFTPPQVSLGPTDSGSPGSPTIFENYHFVDQDLFLQSGAHDIVIRGLLMTNNDSNGACIKSSADGTVQRVAIEYVTASGGSGTTRTLEYCLQLWGDDYEIAYCDLSLVPDHIQINGARPIVHDNYCHAVNVTTGDHCDTFQSNNGTDGGHIYHNTFQLTRSTDGTVMDQTGCVSLFQDDNNTAYTNWLVEDNLVTGPVGGGSLFYCGWEQGKGAGRLSGTNVRFINNKARYVSSTSGSTFAAAQPWGSAGNSNSGNVWFNGPLVGQPVV